MLDSNGQKRWEWAFDRNVFGTRAANEDPSGTRKPFEFNLRFPGQYYDAETGLHYNYFRDYEPGVGRYVQSDPIGLSGGVNTFSYVDSKVFTSVDPYGLVKHFLIKMVVCDVASSLDNWYNAYRRWQREGCSQTFSHNLLLAQKACDQSYQTCNASFGYMSSIGQQDPSGFSDCVKRARCDCREQTDDVFNQQLLCARDIPEDFPFDFEFCVFKPVIFDGPRR